MKKKTLRQFHLRRLSGGAIQLLVSLLVSSVTFAQSLTAFPTASPSSVNMSPAQLAYIDQAVEAEIARKQLPGAVVLVGRQGKIVWRRAYGNRALEPQPEPMSVDTIFDLASLTKVVATATSVMILVERGQVRLGDPVSRYIPEFADAGKKNITVEQLLIHRSGLIADNAIEDYQQGIEKAWLNLWRLPPIAEAGAKFIYSDVNFIVLAELVRRVSGKTVDEFAAENIYRPLGMKDTGYKPAANLQSRIAPTEKRKNEERQSDRNVEKQTPNSALQTPGSSPTTDFAEHWMRGEVHDPRAYLLGGVAGHAGLFSTADDLAIFCQMMLNGGEFQGQRILSPAGVARLTEPQPSGGNGTDGDWRGLGWDVKTRFSANRGDLFSSRSFGHTGFTGTSLSIDPVRQTFVVFLSNRVHPHLDPKQPADVTSLRGRISSIVASSITVPATNETTPLPPAMPSATAALSPGYPRTPGSELRTLNGIDVLVRDNFAQLKGRRIGIITNHTGKDREGRSTIDLLFAAPDVKVVALFSPEHGIRGALDQEKITNSVDEKTKLPIYSLYGETRQPTAEMFRANGGIDTLVFDIQDVGARFYTYISTMGLAMEAAAKNGVKFVVLDRVNPINGRDVEGSLADAGSLSFIAYHAIPIRHGMTVGELAMLFNKERNINADLQVVRVEDWKRTQWFDETGLVWINPSPNMRSLTEATLYPGVCLLEPTNVSVGRGTDTPFEIIGAPYIDGRKLAEALNTARLPGVRFVPVRFTPKASVHKDAECGGVNLIITNRQEFEAVIVGLEIASQLLKMYPKEFTADKFNRLLVSQKLYEAFRLGADSRALRQMWQPELEAFQMVRSKYLMY
jgi:uncharacterized protein YbbC (DUF1343 family)